MKRCPRCGQIYTDDLIYCLQDGNELLTQEPDGETPTVIRPPRPATKSSSTPYLKYFAIALIGLFVIGLAGAAGAYFVWTKLAGEEERSSVTPSAEPAPVATPTKPKAEQNNDTEPPPAVPDRPANKVANSLTNVDSTIVDPSTSRITFRRGRASETVNGRISKRRSFVLRTLAGQRLSASVSSERNCVAFSDGSSEIEYSTPQGDSRLTLGNNCPAVVRFSLRVAVR